MGINKLAEATLIIVLMAAAVGQLPRLNRAVSIAQIQLLKDSQSSRWGRAMQLFAKRDLTNGTVKRTVTLEVPNGQDKR
ncbi:MAG: hypothetical protein HC883_01220 [Bdellovibrionaceae bacterium]|nr:hypothetical protein [Pseudobdellovibrionaceae bacterium]